VALGAGQREIFRLIVGTGMGLALSSVPVGVPGGARADTADAWSEEAM
jgi:hypothetical protein